jgi:hypothetical protein
MVRLPIRLLSFLLAASAIARAAPGPQESPPAATSSAPAAPSSALQQAAPVPEPVTVQESAPRSSTPPNAGKAKRAADIGLFAVEAWDWQAAFEHFSEAVELAPDNKDYVFELEMARSQLVREYTEHAERDALAGRLDTARGELLTALALVPGDKVILERLHQFEAMNPAAASEPATISSPIQLKPKEGTHSFQYRGDLMGAYREVAQEFGLVAEFDPELQPHGGQFRWQADDVDFFTAMRLLQAASGTFWIALNPRIFFVANDTQQKRRDFQPVSLRTIPLRAAASNEQMTEDQRIIRDIVGISRVSLDTANHALTIKAPEQQMKVAEGLIDSLDRPPGELLLEVDVLEADRNLASALGFTPPQSASTYPINSLELQEAQGSLQGLIDVITQVFGQPSSLGGISTSQIGSLVGAGQLSLSSLIPPVLAFGGGATTFLYALSGGVANFSSALGLVRSGQRIQLRAQDSKMATFFVGDRYPITLGQYSSSLGGTPLPAVSSQTFPTTYYAAGTTPVAVAPADFNNDGFVDLAVADKTTNMVSILLNDGTGAFGTPTTFATGNTPVALATGDFNADGNMDIAIVNQADATVSILLGKGDGTFAVMTGPVTGTLPTSIAVADFNGDGLPDLVVTNGTSNTVSIFLGNGDGTFQAKTDYNTGVFPLSVTVADFNLDGIPDFAVANFSSNTVSIFLNTGTGGVFGARSDYITGNGPAGVANADFNLDGYPDIAVVNQTGNTVSVFLNLADGAGTFNAPTAYATGDGPTSISTGDFNVDGLPDLAVANMTDNTVAVLLNGGSGTFIAPFALPVGTQPVYVATADFNNDNSPDLVLADYQSANVAIILNTITSYSPGTSQGQTPFPNSEYEDLGLKVQATPRIHSDGEVTLEMKIEIKSLAGSSINEIPIIANRSFEQTVRLKEDETTIMAGILQDNESLGINGTPGLAYLPKLGYLFGTRSVTDQGTELLVMITPRLVRRVPHVDRVIYAGHDSGASGPVGLPFGRSSQFPLPPQPPEPRVQQ